MLAETGILLRAVYSLLGTDTLMSNVAFNAGSSKQGNILRAPVGSRCVAARALKNYNQMLLMIYF